MTWGINIIFGGLKKAVILVGKKFNYCLWFDPVLNLLKVSILPLYFG